MRTAKAAWLAALLVLLLMPAPVHAAAQAQLATARANAAVVSTGETILIFGGDGRFGGLQDIPQFHPATGTVNTMKARLPSACSQRSAVWTGTYAYIVGGCDPNVLQYDPAGDTLTTLPFKMPESLSGTSAVWAGGEAFYVFGGRGPNGLTNRIIEVNPAAQSARYLAQRLPFANAETSAVYDGNGHAFLFGGWHDGGFENRIVEVGLPSGASTVLATALPAKVTWTSAAWLAGSAYILGGGDGTQSLATVSKFDPVRKVLDAAPMMPQPGRERAGAAVVGDTIWLVGGKAAGPETLLDSITPYTVPAATRQSPGLEGLAAQAIALALAALVTRRT